MPETSKARLIGGQPRVVRVEPDPDRMAAAGVTWMRAHGRAAVGGGAPGRGHRGAGQPRDAHRGGPLFRERGRGGARAGRRSGAGARSTCRDVARVVDGPDEAAGRGLLLARARARGRGAGPPARVPGGHHRARQATGRERDRPRRSGSWARWSRCAHAAAGGACTWRSPATTARPPGRSRTSSSQHLLVATLSVVALISLAMGWRSGLVVGIAVPVTLALTLFIYYLAGYTLNRVTLFALIFSIGILVDDAIVVVENIERHHREKPGRRCAQRHRGGGRGGQPHHPGHLHRDRGHPADGLRARADGAVHAARSRPGRRRP